MNHLAINNVFDFPLTFTDGVCIGLITGTFPILMGLLILFLNAKRKKAAREAKESLDKALPDTHVRLFEETMRGI